MKQKRLMMMKRKTKKILLPHRYAFLLSFAEEEDTDLLTTLWMVMMRM